MSATSFISHRMFVAALERPRPAPAAAAPTDSAERHKSGSSPNRFMDARFSGTLSAPSMPVRAPWAAYLAGI